MRTALPRRPPIRRGRLRRRGRLLPAFEEIVRGDIVAAEGVETVDLADAICAEDRCFGVIGNALVYRDNDHLTHTFARTMAPWLERELRRLGG